MPSIKLLSSIFFIIFIVSVLSFSQQKPKVGSNELMLNAEINSATSHQARDLAVKNGLPIEIYLDEGILIHAVGIENNKPVYVIIKNLAHPFIDAETVFYETIEQRYELAKARVNYGNGIITNPLLGHYNPNSNFQPSPISVLMVPDWTNDRVMAFDINTGDLVDADFIPSNSPSLQSPKEAVLNSRGFISVSDQISDLVQKYDTNGAYLGFFAPAGGVSTAILDNIRGHAYRPNGNLVVTVGSSANQNSVAEFDTAGNYIGQFIATSSGGLNSPFGICFRENDVLVTGSSSNAAHRYTLSGTYLDNFTTGIAFAQQVIELRDKNIAIAGFSTPSGLRIYSPTGTLLSYFTGVSGNRGVYQLGNNNYLTTNSAGIHELDSNTGSLVRTIFASSNLQYITMFDPSGIIPVELTSFSAEEVNGKVQLNWTTATEKNNLGFDVERAASSEGWEKIGFVGGNGTTTNVSTYSFIDHEVQAGSYSYRLKQIDFDGSANYSNTVEVSVLSPKQFALNQNFPNPFNPSTVISWQLPVRSYVTLRVYDVLGNEVATLVNETKEAGTYNSQFSLSSYQLSSGVCFYQLRANDFVSSKKMILAK